MKTPPMPGENRFGAVVYDFPNIAFQATIATVPGLTSHWIDDFVEDIYPRGPANSQRC
jgi:hypothetical protein